MGFSSDQDTSWTESNPWAPAGGQLQDILQRAREMFEQGDMDFERDSGYLDGAGDWYQGIAGGNEDIGFDDVRAGADSLWDDKLEQSMRDQSIRDTNQMAAGNDAQAAATGGMGSSRTGLAQAAGASGIQNDMNQQFGQMRQDNLNTSLGLLGGNRDTRLGGGDSAIGIGREESDLDFENQQSQLQALQAYLAIVGGIAGLGGGTSGGSTGGGFNGNVGDWVK